MRRAWSSAAVAAMVLACAGPRAERVHDEAGVKLGGTPSVTPSWPTAELAPDARGQEPPAIDEPGRLDEPGSEPTVTRAPAPPPEDTRAQTSGEDRLGSKVNPTGDTALPTVSGSVVDVSEQLIVVQDANGRRHRLGVDHQSMGWREGTQLGPGVLSTVLEEGDSVRASFLRIGDASFVRALEVLEAEETPSPAPDAP